MKSFDFGIHECIYRLDPEDVVWKYIQGFDSVLVITHEIKGLYVHTS